jgi:hypothetical protein
VPLDRYDSAFGGKAGSAKKVRASLIKQHGEKEGNRIFYAMVRDRGGKPAGLRDAMDDRKAKRGRFKPKPKPQGLRGAMAARKR